MFAVTAPAFGASFTVVSGTDTTPKTVGNDDTGTIASGATLSAPTAIIWTGGSTTPGVVIDNGGVVSAVSRAIDTSGAFSLGSLTLTNRAGARLIASNNDALRINTDIVNGTITVNNAGLMVAGAVDASGKIVAGVSGPGFDLAAIVSGTAVTQITNSAGGVIGSSGGDAIRLGAGSIVISNSGLIDATASNHRAVNLNTSDLANVASFQVTNAAGGIIQAQSDAIRVTAATTTGNPAGNFVINNTGIIQSTGTGIANNEAIDFSTLSSPNEKITITNGAGGIIKAADADAIQAGENTAINNSGQIIAQTAGGPTANTGIVFNNHSGGVLNNLETGSIIGAHHGINSAQPVDITNLGTITGQDGSGLNLNTPVKSNTNIENRGTISGKAVTGDGNGINVAGLVTLSNYGTISAAGTSPVPTDVTDAISVGGGTINNFAGGQIVSSQRAIFVNGLGAAAFVPSTIYNEGTIEGDNGIAISTFGPLDTVTNKGTIIGGIILNGGNNTLNVYTGSSITGAISGGGVNNTVNLQGTGTGDFPGATGFQTLNVQSGTWTLSQPQSYGAATVANGATLVVSGQLTAALNVFSGGRLQGTGAVIGSVMVNGVVAPGNSPADPIGTMTVGSIDFASGSTYEADVTAGGPHDLIAAGGAAVIESGTTVAVQARNGSYDASNNYLLVSAGSVSGQFSSVTLSANAPFLIPSLTYTPTTVTLTLSRNPTFLTQRAVTPNQIAVAQALDASRTNAPLFRAVVPLTGSDATQAFDALSGEIYATILGALLENSHFLANAAFGHLDEERAQGRTGLWLDGAAMRTHFRGDGNAAESNADFNGIAGGADFATSNIMRVGLAGGYSQMHERAPLRSSEGNVRSYYAGGYGQISFDGWGLDAGGSYDWHHIDANRAIVFPGVNGAPTTDYSAHAYEASTEIYYHYAPDALWIEPLGRFDWTQVHIDNFREAGGFASVAGINGAQQVKVVDLGFRTGMNLEEGEAAIMQRIMIAWQHGFGERTPIMVNTFPSTGTSFVVSGVPIDRDALLAGAGLDFLFAAMVHANFSYAGQFGRHAINHSAAARLSVQF
jgi:uncharacterized protein with beta-barrel porin domain